MLAKRASHFMVSLTVMIGLWLLVFCLCLVTVFVAIPIVSTLLMLSVASSKLKQIIKKGKNG